ncbi:hypothetical protein PPROV_000161300 [Pycnococcus provasolii]|uniref:Major facilitator superfamily (MFS) profile domain-containing protein n=1 Tax=Pycnococcus provasolii TaxID=41880 RepID=A0A830H856_9CHLO|nr:hypothetical protein PPROV_000161300 [Pycnococcus provasolii]
MVSSLAVSGDFEFDSESSPEQSSEEQSGVASAHDVTLRKVDVRVLLLLWLIALVAYLDRSALAYAAPLMRSTVNLSDASYGAAASAFFATYVLFEVPSNICLSRLGSPRWLAFILAGWGVAAASTAFVTTSTQLVITRLVLGAFEAGAFPGCAYTVQQWYGCKRFINRYPVVTTATALAGAVGGPLAALLLATVGWKGVFIVEGALLALPLAAVVLRRLPRSPEQATWLSPQEVNWIQAEAKLGGDDDGGCTAQQAFRDWRTWWLGVCWLLLEIPTYGCVFWIPQFVSSAAGFAHDDDHDTLSSADLARRAVTVSLLSAIPFSLAAAANVGAGHLVRTRGGRREVVAAVTAFAGSLTLAAAPHAGKGTLVVLSLAAALIWAAQAPLLGIAPTFLRGEAMAAGFAAVNAVGQMGGLVGPYLVGIVKSKYGGDADERAFAAAFALLGAFGALCAPMLLLYAWLTSSKRQAASYLRVEDSEQQDAFADL